MAKTNLRASLAKSVKAESKHIEQRFAKAEEMLPTKKVRVEKVKVVRDTFSMPVSDYELIQLIQDSWLKFGISATRSEIIRAGLAVLSGTGKLEVEKTLAGLVKLKPGRGKNH